MIDQATELFRSHFGAAPAGVWSAPGRANLIGEHVDYAAGICLPFALAQRTYIAAGLNDRGTYRLISGKGGAAEIPLADVRPGYPNDWTGYVAGTVWAAMQSGGVVAPQLGVGLDFAIVSNVPVGGGLSSSAALECAAALAARDLLGGGTREQLMHAAIRAENDVVGASTGGLDQRISLFAEAAHALAIDFGTDEHYQVPFDLEPHKQAILVTNTNAPHTLADGQYAARRAVIDGVTELVQSETGHPTLRAAHEAQLDMHKFCDQWAAENGADQQMVRNRVDHVTGEIARTAAAIEMLKAGDMDSLGRALSASHASLRDLYEVTVDELNLAVDVAMEHGALGARMVGGGFGGSTIALIPINKIDAAAAAIQAAFADAGFNTPECEVAVASGGAQRNL